jgi:hypothetical protein
LKLEYRLCNGGELHHFYLIQKLMHIFGSSNSKKIMQLLAPPRSATLVDVYLDLPFKYW